MIPLAPTVRDELLFQTGAPELVVQNGELKALDGRYCIITSTGPYIYKFHRKIRNKVKR